MLNQHLLGDSMLKMFLSLQCLFLLPQAMCFFDWGGDCPAQILGQGDGAWRFVFIFGVFFLYVVFNCPFRPWVEAWLGFPNLWAHTHLRAFVSGQIMWHLKVYFSCANCPPPQDICGTNCPMYGFGVVGKTCLPVCSVVALLHLAARELCGTGGMEH